MSEKRLYSYDKGNNKVLCNLEDVCDFNVRNVFQLLNSLANENEQLQKQLESSETTSNATSNYNAFLESKITTLEKENGQLRRYVYHCPQLCKKIIAYLGKCETEDVKAVNDAMDDDKYFDEEIDTLRS